MFLQRRYGFGAKESLNLLGKMHKKLETYVIVGNPDETEYGMYVKKGWVCQDWDNPNNQITHDLDGNKLEVLHTFQAKDWDAASRY